MKKSLASQTFRTAALFATALFAASTARAQAVDGNNPMAVVVAMVAHEDAAELHRGHFEYLSVERSDRTGGHLWKEKVAETNAGKVHYLLQIDGVDLTPEQQAQERGRLAAIVADPAAFQKREETRKNDEQHAKDLMDLLPKAFLFSNPRREGDFMHLDMNPNPAYSPQSIEERVMDHMVGSIVIQMTDVRLREVQGRLPEDVNIAFGLLATIRAGSHFDTTRRQVYGNEWKTQTLDTDVQGHAILFKTIGKKAHAEHSDFQLLPHDMTVAEAIARLEQ